MVNGFPVIIPLAPQQRPPPQAEFRVLDVFGMAQAVHLESIHMPGYFLCFHQSGARLDGTEFVNNERVAHFEVALVSETMSHPLFLPVGRKQQHLDQNAFSLLSTNSSNSVDNMSARSFFKNTVENRFSRDARKWREEKLVYVIILKSMTWRKCKILSLYCRSHLETIFHQEDWKAPQEDTLKQHLQAIERPQECDMVRRVQKNPDMMVPSLIHPGLKNPDMALHDPKNPDMALRDPKNPDMALHDPKDLDMNRRRWILTNTVLSTGNIYSAFYFVMEFYS